MDDVKIIINKKSVDDYLLYYFVKYPKRKKPPITKPIPPSLNDWMIMPRFKMNSQKQIWKEFGIWLIKENNLENMKINKCEITIEYFFKDKRKRDSDNYTPKNLFDSFVISGLLIDDDFGHVESLTLKGNYSKEDPRMEITFSEIKLLGDEDGTTNI